MEELTDVHGLHQRIGPPPSYWYSLAESGKIPHFKIGKYLRFRVSEVEAWIESQRRGPRPETPGR